MGWPILSRGWRDFVAFAVASGSGWKRFGPIVSGVVGAVVAGQAIDGAGAALGGAIAAALFTLVCEFGWFWASAPGKILEELEAKIALDPAEKKPTLAERNREDLERVLNEAGQVLRHCGETAARKNVKYIAMLISGLDDAIGRVRVFQSVYAHGTAMHTAATEYLKVVKYHDIQRKDRGLSEPYRHEERFREVLATETDQSRRQMHDSYNDLKRECLNLLGVEEAD